MKTKNNFLFDEYAYDYYRMTGELYRIGFKSFLQRCMRHNLQFAFLYRKYRQKATIYTKFKLYRMSRKYGLEISTNAQIGNDVLIAPNSCVNIDVPDHSVVIGNLATIHANENATKGYINFRV